MPQCEDLIMPLDEIILETVRRLPVTKQREVLDFAQFLEKTNGAKEPLRSLKGLCADLNVTITAAAIDEARREMWGSFPRGDI